MKLWSLHGSFLYKLIKLQGPSKKVIVLYTTHLKSSLLHCTIPCDMTRPQSWIPTIHWMGNMSFTIWVFFQKMKQKIMITWDTMRSSYAGWLRIIGRSSLNFYKASCPVVLQGFMFQNICFKTIIINNISD